MDRQLRSDRQGWPRGGELLLAGLLVRSVSRLPAATPPTAEPPNQIPVKNWRYTVTAPPSAWSSVDFDAAGWSQGEPGFGNQGLPPLQQSLLKTAWTTPDIWGRAEFELDRISPHLALRLSHDEDVQVFLNGVLVCQRKGYIADYAMHRLEGSAARALCQGKNRLAVHCHQTIGGQFLDVQLVDLGSLLPPRRAVEKIMAELGPIPRPEHPRPDRLRPDWLNLNGVWEFAFDPQDVGLKEGGHDGRPLPGRIVVPFCPESLLSGVYDEDFHPLGWYARRFDVPAALRGRRVLLHFGAVDYRTDVWLNGRPLGRHVGGYDPFEFDITAPVKPSDNRLVVRVHDDPHEATPHGKQSPQRRGHPRPGPDPAGDRHQRILSHQNRRHRSACEPAGRQCLPAVVGRLAPLDRRVGQLSGLREPPRLLPGISPSRPGTANQQFTETKENHGKAEPVIACALLLALPGRTWAGAPPIPSKARRRSVVASSVQQ